MLEDIAANSRSSRGLFCDSPPTVKEASTNLLNCANASSLLPRPFPFICLRAFSFAPKASLSSPTLQPIKASKTRSKAKHKERQTKEEEEEEEEANLQNSASLMAEPNSLVIHSPTTKNPASDFPAQKDDTPPKVLSSFLYKAIIFAIFIALLPLFPHQTPESTNPTFLSRTWELLHLLLVGIAVSYGLFSRRNADAADADLDKEKDATFKSDANSYVSRILQISSALDYDESKAEIWSSQHHRADPVIVERKPLLLPVRSLKKSRVQNSDSLGSSSEVLCSPVPWKSRSGRMEVRDQGAAMANDSPSSSFHGKACSFSSNEGTIREKSFRVASPPPPPPPPPSFSHGSLLSTRREVKKSFKDELKDLSVKGRDGFLKSSYLDSSSPRSARTVRAKEAQSMERTPAMQQQKYHAEMPSMRAFCPSYVATTSKNPTSAKTSYDRAFCPSYVAATSKNPTSAKTSYDQAFFAYN